MLCLVLLALPSVCRAGPAVEIIDFGLYDLSLGETLEAPETGTGVTTMVSNETLLQETRVIPARVGVEFGYRYQITGVEPGSEITLLYVLKRPPLVHPDTGDISRMDRHEKTSAAGEADFDGYGFEFDWEMVSGEWSFEIYDRDRLLSAQSFTVIEE